MRVTIKISQRHRKALRTLAVQRRQRGYSGVLGEAIEEFLTSKHERVRQRTTFLSLAGSLPVEEGNELPAAVQTLRKNWR